MQRRDNSEIMAELSTLSPSPPALGDPHAAPSIPASSAALPAANTSAPEATRENSIAKSSLCNDSTLSGNSPAAHTGDVSLSLQSFSTPPALPAETQMTFLGHDPASHREASVKYSEPGAHIMKQEMGPSEPAQASETETPLLASDASTQSEEQPASPESNSGPNLYPNVHVTHNPRPGMDVGQRPADQPQLINTSKPTSGSPESSNTAAPAEEEKPQPLEQAQEPQTQLPPHSPQPDTPNDASKADLPLTPTRVEHSSPTVPVIHEPAYSVPLPIPRPAPDTLSYLESASLMSGTLESLSGLGDDGSSIGSDSEINGLTIRRTDKYGFLGGSQYSESW